MNPPDQPTPTPETNKEVFICAVHGLSGTGSRAEHVPASFARQLEQQRDQAKKLNADLETELDIAREERDSLRKRWMESPECKSQNLARREIQARLEAESERDAAIAKNERENNEHEKGRKELKELLSAAIAEREKLREAADRMRVEAQPFVGYACDEPPTDCECQNCKLRRASRAYDALLSTLKP